VHVRVDEHLLDAPGVAVFDVGHVRVAEVARFRVEADRAMLGAIGLQRRLQVLRNPCGIPRAVTGRIHGGQRPGMVTE
jgi:hypothetical protein